ncbi:MAG: hypothetical protein H0X37_13960 [Herpetosiphonaceae bacterium]|nr:hypothetical protein [Herpetosiphonaceae bacterium]
MSVLTLVHDRLSVTTLLFMLALGAWGLLNYFRGEGITGSYWGALVIAEALVLLEGLLGATLFASGHRPARTTIHILYGFVMVLSIPGAFSYTKGRTGRGEMLIYALVALFLAGVTIRARLTGAGV